MGATNTYTSGWLLGQEIKDTENSMSFFLGDLYTCIWKFLAVECGGKNTRPGIRRPVGTEDPMQGPSNYCLNLVLSQTQGS